MPQEVLQSKDIAAIAQVFHRKCMTEAVGVDFIVTYTLFDPVEHALCAALSQDKNEVLISWSV